MRAKIFMLLCVAVVSIVLVTSGLAFAGDNEFMMEMLNAMGKGLDNNAKMKDCIGGNYQANWDRCNSELQQRTNQQIQQFQRRNEERSIRNEERRNRDMEKSAVEACDYEKDPRAFERCVREFMR
ncbi:MAG: hypothetical protein ABL983_01535 [Nitrospira sp.]